MTEAALDYLSAEDLLEIAQHVVAGDVVLRDAGLLASAAGRPRASAFGEEAYPTFADKTAAVMHSIAPNHALVDGNKRLAWAATRVFCLVNGRDLRLTVDEAEQLILAVARGELDVPEIARSIGEHLHAENS